MSNSIIIRNIPKNAKNIVVFVHGLGSRWDSRGMFTEIKDSLPKNWGSILFDLYYIEGTDVYVSSISEQVDNLKEIIAETKNKNPDARIHIISHSKGCIITAIAMPEVLGNIILLSPPEMFGTKIQSYFERYPGAKKTKSEIIVPRKDRTTTHIPLKYFKESQDVDVQGVMINLSRKHQIILIQTMNDEVLGHTSYDKLQKNKAIKIKQLDADHNFTGESRIKLINLIKELLK